jgi:hypothetical protein
MCNLTSIIPVKIDSEQRKKNIDITLRYLLQNTDSKIIITECDDHPKFDVKHYNSDRIKYKFEKIQNNFFHRTRLINQMLNEVDTPVVANYDADVFLPKHLYEIAEQLILTNQADVIYPYKFNTLQPNGYYDGLGQIRIFSDTPGLDKFYKTLNIDDLTPDQRSPWPSQYGHVQFFNTDCYIKGFMENENYIHWCPEDQERGIRFQKLGYRVIWLDSLVYHQEHPPSTQSQPSNLHKIYKLHNYLIQENKESIETYYRSQEYLKKYDSYKKLCTA